jgi:hypothetical protein
MAGHSRPKDGVASLAYAGHSRLSSTDFRSKSWMPATSAGMTEFYSASFKKLARRIAGRVFLRVATR